MAGETTDLTPGTMLTGVRSDVVTVVAVSPRGESVIFRCAFGRYGNRLLYARDLATIAEHLPDRRWTLDAGGEKFRLAAEALWIRMAGIHDPMLAVTTSNIRPCLTRSKPSTKNCCPGRRAIPARR